MACLGHDSGHIGLSNRFLINSGHKIALRYNDFSVLENLHASITCQIIESENCNFVQHFHPNEKIVIRKLIIDMILATDMNKHFSILGSFRTILPTVRKLKPNDMESKLLLYQIMLKWADLSHAAKKFELHEKWTLRLCDEFFYQGDAERLRGMTISTYCDREHSNMYD